jgi:nucleotidyltransferase/DNA polymerase involved in DNA repair
MQQLLEKEKEHLAATGTESELLKVRGMGPSLVTVITAKGIDTIEKLVAMPKDGFIAAVEWNDKEELSGIYDNALLINNEKLITEGKKEDISDAEKEKFQKSVEITKSILLRLAAAGFMTVDSVAAVGVEEFTSRLGLEEAKAASVYNAITKG